MRGRHWQKHREIKIKRDREGGRVRKKKRVKKRKLDGHTERGIDIDGDGEIGRRVADTDRHAEKLGYRE